MNMAKRFVQRWDELRKNSMGLLMWGNVGTGKTGPFSRFKNRGKFTKKQKVTEVFYNAKDPIAEVHTHDANLKKRLRKYAAKYPELCKLTDDDGQGGLRFDIDKSRIRIRLTAPYTADRRKAASELAKKKGFTLLDFT